MSALRVVSMVLTAVLVAAIVAGCSGASGLKPQTSSATAVPVATETPTVALSPTPTADPKAELADKAYGQIIAMQAMAAMVAYQLDPIARLYTGTTVKSATGEQSGDFVKRWGEVLDSCKLVRMPALEPTIDLWPGPYEKLGSSLWSTCQVIIDHAKASAPAATDEWTAVAVSVTRALNGASAQLPDYSQAQLKRAIADRQ